MDCRLPGSSVHGILQARILEWVAILFSRGSSWPRHQTWVSCIASRFFTVWAIKEAQNIKNKINQEADANSGRARKSGLEALQPDAMSTFHSWATPERSPAITLGYRLHGQGWEWGAMPQPPLLQTAGFCYSSQMDLGTPSSRHSPPNWRLVWVWLINETKPHDTWEAGGQFLHQ